MLNSVKNITQRSDREAELLQELLKLEQKFSGIRHALRTGLPVASI